MKFTKIAAAAAISTLIGTSAIAGGMSEPMMEPVMAPVIVEEEAGTSGGFVIPLLLLAVIAAVAVSD